MKLENKTQRNEQKSFFLDSRIRCFTLIKRIFFQKRNKNTIKTLIHRLVQKGAIESRKVNTKEVVYIPKINEKKFLSKESNSFLKKFFNGSTERLLLN